MDRRFLVILAALVAVFAAIFLVSSGGGKQPSSASSPAANGQATSHVEGQGKSGVTLVEYADYECSACSMFYPIIKQAVAQNSSQIYFQFRNLPLTAIHPNAFAAARAAEAAGLQGKYWQMHDWLYENQTKWAADSSPQSLFRGYANQMGLDLNRFDSDYAGSKVNDAINADTAAFAKTGQEKATPTFFLDGKYLTNSSLIDQTSGQVSLSLLDSIIKHEISAKAK